MSLNISCNLLSRAFRCHSGLNSQNPITKTEKRVVVVLTRKHQEIGSKQVTMVIRNIEVADVHRITSGQVIVDMTSIVKEVVENSLDANATVVEVEFKNYGLDSITVSDNGDGISEEDFESIALKHHTSKLSSFNELEKVHTLGFRGEALSSLCSIGSLGIVTTQSPPMAHQLTFKESGALDKTTICKGSKGTTVTVSSLFKNLPVRLKDLTKNIKREFNKCISLLQSYALINTKVKFVVRNVNSKGKKVNMLHSQGLNSLKSNIISIFGSTGLQGLVPLDIELDLNLVKSKLKISDFNDDYTIKLDGFVSKVGFGRAAKDRQYFFINKRPVNLRKWAQVINETYKTFNATQLPVIILDITISPGFLDLNVTPDKRTVLINNEDAVLDELRSSMIQFYDAQDLSLPRTTRTHKLSFDENESDETISTLRSRFSSSIDDTLVDDTPRKRPLDEIEDQSSTKRAKVETIRIESIEVEEENDECTNVHEVEEENDERTNIHEIEEADDLNDVVGVEIDENVHNHVPELEDTSSSEEENLEEVEPTVRPSKKLLQPTFTNKLTTLKSLSAFKLDSQEEPALKEIQSTVDTIIHRRGKCNHDHDSEEESQSDEEDEHIEEVNNDEEDSTRDELELVKYKEIGTSEFFEVSVGLPVQFAKPLTGKPVSRQKVDLDDINNQEESENYLTLTVSKKDFKNMKIIGQFNLGFILVTRELDNKRDMFIIDQHASDEKYNFEQLQRDTVMESQRMVVPQSLELSVIDELVVIDNQDVITKNGFQLSIDMDGIPGNRIKLVSLPMSKRITFDTVDFYELLHLIKEQQSNTQTLRCSKVRSMLAMRACRKSIMIGKHLSHRQMSQVVSNLGDLDKPWNCPHGRPTMRHLTELEWEPFREDYSL